MANLEQRKHLAVIDDDQDMLDLITAYFKPKGYNLTCFSDAESAIEACAKNGETWDALISDLKLPKMSGVDLTEKIKEKLPDLPIILITTSNSAETAVEAIQKGAYDFIVKPIHFPQLQISIERALYLRSLRGDITQLREKIKSSTFVSGNIVGRSPKFLEAFDVAKRVAKSTASIFIRGESGTGKEVFAKLIHNESNRNKGPFVAINCSAIPENLLESELFGHAKGSFTGAIEKRVGLFEEAENGTLFLDEIGDLSLSLQAKLLRVLQEKKIKRVGENQYRAINCRIISATHKNIVNEVKEGRFREDLFFRLNVIPISIPPLRERPEDILPLAEMFLKKFALENGSPARIFSKEAIHFILENQWRGNVRELENSIERAVVLSSGPEVGKQNFLPQSVELSGSGGGSEMDTTRPTQNGFFLEVESALPTLNEVIQKYIEFAVDHNQGARDRTAKDLGIDRKTLYKRLKPENHMIN